MDQKINVIDRKKRSIKFRYFFIRRPRKNPRSVPGIKTWSYADIMTTEKISKLEEIRSTQKDGKTEADFFSIAKRFQLEQSS